MSSDFNAVRGRGLEPPRVTPPEPKGAKYTTNPNISLEMWCQTQSPSAVKRRYWDTVSRLRGGL